MEILQLKEALKGILADENAKITTDEITLKSKTLYEIMKCYSDEHLGYDRCYYIKSAIKYFENNTLTWRNFVKYLYDGLNGNVKSIKNPNLAYKAETMYSQYSLIHSAFMHCEHSGFIPPNENIVSGKHLPPQMANAFKKKRRKEYSEVVVNHDVFENFLNFYLLNRSTDTSLREIGLLAYYTGMRLSEVCNLKWSDIKTNYIFLTKTKERHNKKSPLDTNALNLLRKIKKSRFCEYVFPNLKDLEKPISSRVVSQLFYDHWKKYQELNKEANFPFSFKSFRTANIHTKQSLGLSAEDIRKSVGHKNGFITDNSYSGTLAPRAMEEFTTNPINEITREINTIIRREFCAADVMCLDMNLFREGIRELINKCTQNTDDEVLSIGYAFKGKVKKQEQSVQILQFAKFG